MRMKIEEKYTYLPICAKGTQEGNRRGQRDIYHRKWVGIENEERAEGRRKLSLHPVCPRGQA